jgi:hypothetical protein
MNIRSNSGYALMLTYIIGNALTYNHLFRAGRSAVGGSEDVGLLIVKSLVISTVWPVYWLYHVIAG